MDAQRSDYLRRWSVDLVALAVLCLFGAGAVGADLPLKHSKIVERTKPSVAYISGKHSSGSGFLVLPNVIATNSHVIRDEMIEDVSIRFLSKTGVESAVLKPQLLSEDKSRDLALLLVHAQSDRKPLAIATDFEPGPGKLVLVLGNPAQDLGYTRVNAVGTGTADDIVMISKCPFYQLRIKTNKDAIDVGHGTSGGPVLDSSGQVVGILTSGIVDKKGHSTGKCFCVPSHALSALVGPMSDGDQHARHIKSATARHALDLAAINLYLSSQVSRLVVDLRVDTAKHVTRANARRYLETDGAYIEAFSAFDRQVRDMSGPALRLALDGTEITPARKRDLIDLREFAGQAAGYTRQKILTPGEHKRCLQVLNQADRAFQRLKESIGLSDEVVHDMTIARISAVRARLGK